MQFNCNNHELSTLFHELIYYFNNCQNSYINWYKFLFSLRRFFLRYCHHLQKENSHLLLWLGYHQNAWWSGVRLQWWGLPLSQSGNGWRTDMAPRCTCRFALLLVTNACKHIQCMIVLKVNYLQWSRFVYLHIE